MINLPGGDLWNGVLAAGNDLWGNSLTKITTTIEDKAFEEIIAFICPYAYGKDWLKYLHSIDRAVSVEGLPLNNRAALKPPICP